MELGELVAIGLDYVDTTPLAVGISARPSLTKRRLIVEARYKRDVSSPRSCRVIPWPNDPRNNRSIGRSSSDCRNQSLSGGGCTSTRRAEHDPQYFLRLALKRGKSPPSGAGLGSYCCERVLRDDASLGQFKH